MRTGKAWIAVLGLALALCAGCGDTSDRALYAMAVGAVKAHAEFPQGATVGPRAEARVCVGKNAACIEVPYVAPGEGGQTRKGSFTVWLKRPTLRGWILGRCESTKLYAAWAEGSGGATNSPEKASAP